MTRPSIYTTRVDAVSSSLTYIGLALVGSSESDPSWRILEIAVSGTVTTIKYAGGDTDFNSVWTDRASLSYS